MAPDTFDSQQCQLWYEALKNKARVGDFYVPWQCFVRPEGEWSVAQRPISDENLVRKYNACRDNPTVDYIPCWAILVGMTL